MQGNIDTRFPATAAEAEEYDRQLFEEYLQLQTAWQRRNDWPVPGLIIWPEGKYPIPYAMPGGGETEAAMRRDFGKYYSLLYRELVENRKSTGAAGLPLMIVGCGTIDPARHKTYNSALLLGNQAKVLAAYHKMHLVPFGEFVPYVEWFPVLAEITPIGSGFDAGEQPAGFNVGGLIAAPCICFESAVTHRIRDTVAHLRSLDKEPHFLVNVTDDGWFYGHAALDHHLACNVMRAVENRKPMIVAANTGLSAFIQSDGRILRQGQRRTSDVLELDVELKPRRALYTVVGDWPAIILTLLCVLAIVVPPRQAGSRNKANE